MNPCSSTPSILRSADTNEVLRVNREFTEHLGLTCEDLAPHTLLEWIAAEDRAAFEQVLATGEGNVRARHRSSAGDWVQFDWRVKTHTGNVVALGLLHTGASSDSETTQPAGAHAFRTMAETLERMAHIVEAKNPGMMCSILLVDAEVKYIVGGAGPSLPDAYNRAVEGLRIGPAVGSCGTATFWNMPVVVENIAQDPLWCGLREVAALAGVVSCWSHPLTAMNGDVLGAMALYNTHPCVPNQHQMEGLEIAACMVGLAVERNRLEGQLHQTQKMEALGVLAGGIAHDFNNMLTAILGNAELAADTLPPGAEANAMLQEIVNASISATSLCSQMLAYSGRGAMSVEIMECNAVTRDLGGLLSAALSKKTTLTYELHPDLLGIRADRNQIRQVVMNLITNASEAIGNENGRIVIGTSARTYTAGELRARHSEATLAPGEYVTLRISDTGVGMSAETQARIFDPFFTTKATGRGLGLAAVRGIVRGHEGAITLTTEPGSGTTFEVLLPRVPLPAREASLPTGQKAAGLHAPTTHAAHLLVVDDEVQVRAVLVEILERAGYSVTWARDGQEALAVFRRDPEAFDAVLLDLCMPRLDGYEVFSELRRIRADVRVILSSGFTEQQVMDRFHDTGLTAVIQKPAQKHVLVAKIAEVLGQPSA